MNTFEMTDTINFLEEKLINGEGDPKATEDTIESLQLDRNARIDSAIGLYEKNEARIDWITKKIQDLQKYQKQFQNVNKSLDYYFDQTLKRSGQKEIQTKDHILEWGRKSTRVDVPDVNKIPIDYVRYPDPKPQADKKKLKKDLQKGKKISGAELVTSRKVIIE